MNKTEIEKHRTALEAIKAELTIAVPRCRKGIVIEKTPDAMDEIQLAGECELSIHNLNRGSNLLHNVRDALARIVDGSYGVCLHCEGEIKPKRLDAVPWTEYCLKCQEAVDRNEPDGMPVGELLAQAS